VLWSLKNCCLVVSLASAGIALARELCVLLCRCPALAQVSLREETPPDYALARLIRQQGHKDKVLVAQSAGQLVGCMSVTSMVAVGPLQENFDLQIYDQLVQPDVYEAALAAHAQRSAGATVGKSMTEGVQ